MIQAVAERWGEIPVPTGEGSGRYPPEQPVWATRFTAILCHSHEGPRWI